MDSENFIITETDDYETLVKFFIENELEYAEDDEVPTDLIKCWKAVDSIDGRLVGACVLAKREGRFICDGIATDISVRGKRLGEELLNILINEAKSLGAEAIYLVARAPGFFAKHGFVLVPREGAPTFFECFSCPQFGTTCAAAVMRLSLEEELPEFAPLVRGEK